MQIESVLKALFGDNETETLRQAITRWVNLPLFEECDDQVVAHRLVTVSLWHTFIFGRFILPSYVGHTCLALRSSLPADDQLGHALQGVLGVGIGELATNNVFGRANESHSHYWDMRVAYAQANGNMPALLEFEQRVTNGGLSHALRSTTLWSPSMRTYATMAERLTTRPFETMLLAAVSEEAIRLGYERILLNIPKSPEFSAFRRFLKRHIELDRGDHGPAASEWLETYTSLWRPNRQETTHAIKRVTNLVNARIASYD